MRVLSAAALTLACIAGYGLAPAHAQAPYRVACASGYHADRGGNCQPDAGQTNRYCPTGAVFHPTFDGWSCDPPPREAY